MELWQGRFKKKLDSKTNSFNSSISFDYRLYEQDIKGSLAHTKMLEKQGIIDNEDFSKIEKGLNEILEDIKTGDLEINQESEDIHTFIEEELTKRIGTAGKKLHTARSRNDQIALDIRMYLKEEVVEIKKLLKDLQKVMLEMAGNHINTVMPGYTHLQRAQPITFAHYLMSYVEMLERDIERLSENYKRINVMPLGSCALAGTTHNIDREYTAKLLGFNSVTLNSLDGVSDRDFLIELSFNISMIMMHLSRFSEEIILYSSWEFKFVELDDSFSTGSSIMPQKKNPDIAELVRGKTGRAYGNLFTLLTVMKGLPLAYNKDMQEDKEAIFDSIDTVKICLNTLIPMISTMRVLKNNMKKAAEKGFINATDCADYLTKKGVPFREAYKITGELVSYCIDSDKTLEMLDINEYKKFSDKFDKDIYKEINLSTCVNKRNVIGGPAPEQVKKHIEAISIKVNK